MPTYHIGPDLNPAALFSIQLHINDLEKSAEDDPTSRDAATHVSVLC